MNWLAHFVLSEHQENILIGNWLGEVVKGKKYQKYEGDYQKGIILHREIDSFTDQHPLVKATTKIFHPSQGKFAPVVVDMAFDYFLFTHWQDFEPEEFSSFKKKVYAVLKKHYHLYPPVLLERTKALIYFDWLEKYTTLECIQ